MAIITDLNCNLREAVKVKYLDGNLFSQDVYGNAIRVIVMDGDEPATLSGTVSGIAVRADGGSVAISDSRIDGNVATIVLPAAVYSIPGPISIVIKIADTYTVTTLAAVVTNVYQSSTDTVVDPGTIIPSINALIEQIAAAVATIPADYSDLWTSIAPTFSTGTSYVAGQYVTYNDGTVGKVYRFKNAHSGSWASADVDAVDLGSGITKNANDISDLKSALALDEYFINEGLYQIKKADLESGGWSSGQKQINAKRGRFKQLIHVKAGMTIIYENDSLTQDLYFSVIRDDATAVQFVGWKDNKGGTIDITDDGNLVFMIADHTSHEASVNVAEYNATVIIKTVVNNEIDEIHNNVIDIGNNQNYGYLAVNEGKRILANQTIENQALQSYTDYIRIPENAESITVKGITKNVAGTTTYAINPDVHVYDENLNLLKSYGDSSLNEEKTRSLSFIGAKYIRVNQPSDVQSVSKYIRFNAMKIDGLLTAAHGGLVKAYTVTDGISAYLFSDGYFAVLGRGTAPLFSQSNPPVWVTDGNINLIKDIYIDEKITITDLVCWFSVFTESENQGVTSYATFYGANRIEKRIDIPKSVTSLTAATFSNFNVNHINLYNVYSLSSYSAFPPKARNRHMIISVPKRLCTSAIIESFVNTLDASVNVSFGSGVTRPWAYSNVTIYITDSQELHDAICEYIYSGELMVQRNTTCILCDNLGPDGFPDYWNERMKACITEMLPYLGAQRVAHRNIRNGETKYQLKGMTSLTTYTGFGWPVPQGTRKSGTINESQTAITDGKDIYGLIYAYDNNYDDPSKSGKNSIKWFQYGVLGSYYGQPISTDLGNIAMGLSCTGLVNFIFWRYFNDNFGFANPGTMYRDQQGLAGNPLPIVEINESDLQPFDICCMVDALDGDAGHVAVYLGSFTDENEITHKLVMQSTYAVGCAFGRWGNRDHPYVKYFRLITGFNDSRLNIITYPTVVPETNETLNPGQVSDVDDEGANVE